MQADPLAVRCVAFWPARVEQVDTRPSVLHVCGFVGECGRSFKCAFNAPDGLNHGINRAGTRFGAFHGMSHWFGLNFCRCLKTTKSKRHVGVQTASRKAT